MDLLSQAYHNRFLGLTLVSFEILLEHMQLLSFLKYSLNTEGESWNSSASDFLDGLESSFTLDVESNYQTLFASGAILVSVLLLLYLSLSSFIHNQNMLSPPSPCTWLILLIDHIVGGLFYINLLKIFLSPQYCNDLSMLIVDTSVECWTKDHMLYMELGFLFAGASLILAAGVFTMLRAERKGAEKPLSNDIIIPAAYKILGFGIVALFAPIQEPYLAVGFIGAVALYLLCFESYAEIHIASMRMAALVGLIWGYICCEVVRNDSEAGSDMLIYGWGFSLLFGYSLLHLKALVMNRETRVISIAK